MSHIRYPSPEGSYETAVEIPNKDVGVFVAVRNVIIPVMALWAGVFYLFG